MTKKLNRVLIEHVGTATIYFDRDADRFVVDSNSHGKSYAGLGSARQWARRVGGSSPTLNIPVVVVGRRDNDAPVAATLVACANGHKRVTYEDGASESVGSWRDVLLKRPSTIRTVTRLTAAVAAAETARHEARKALQDYVRENSIPKPLEELIAISRPLKRAKPK